MSQFPSAEVPRRNYRKWAAIGAVAAAIAVIGVLTLGARSRPGDANAAQQADKTPPPVEFTATEVVHLKNEPLNQELLVTGSLDAVDKVTLRAKVAAEVRSIPVREGDRVRAGQLLAQIDTTDAQARLAERVGTYESARANLALAEKNRATNKDLLVQGFISQNAYDAIESGYQANAGQTQAAQANVALARNALQDASVVAPIAGIVSKRHVQPGEKVSLDAALISIVDLRRLELQAMVPADDVPRIRVGSKAQLRVDGYRDRTFVGRVERIAPATEPGTRAVLVLIAIANADEALKAGMFANGSIAIDRSEAVPALPSDAVRTAGGESHVWLIADGKLVKRSVKTGRRDEIAKRVEILSGLDPADTVLAARFDNLREGTPAKVGGATVPASAPAIVKPARGQTS